ncbi:hypothetical protein [Bacillus sp. T33-2]|uniref:hypothetical protein n=1 Tax=Bacillus sp. T33-2 TaxID=2054168 RepID=UPI000C7847F9|nr:hypothetical protein [Bacillus sp. T33-2]PLR92641.1 hypothetical protein CVD19_20510 [Bacillus sp. T33-2]
MNNLRRPYYGGSRFFWGAPFIGGLLGGLVGSALFYPRPFYQYPYYPPYGGFGPYGYGYGYPY